MQVKEVMTASPACCTPTTSLRDVARMMVEHDCGCIPVIEGDGRQKLVGVVTDRDICCRTVAEGKNPLELTARDCMSKQCVTVTPETDIDECCDLMERSQVRRIPVVDANGICCGIVSQADVALHVSEKKAAEVVREVSQPVTASRHA
ncbi:MAG: CBS domain-containing protein [Acidobacteria bacterium]|nr:CBS domain-containing protein [Acidobacteriota bacterium]